MKLLNLNKKNFIALKLKNFNRRDQQLLHAQVQQNWELREVHEESFNEMEELKKFQRHYYKTKISRRSGYFSGVFWRDTRIVK